MNRDAESASRNGQNHRSDSMIRVNRRLKKLRHQRRLVVKAIVALTELCRAQAAAGRLANRN